MAGVTVNPRRKHSSRAKRMSRLLTEGSACAGGNTCGTSFAYSPIYCNDANSQCLQHTVCFLPPTCLPHTGRIRFLCYPVLYSSTSAPLSSAQMVDAAAVPRATRPCRQTPQRCGSLLCRWTPPTPMASPAPTSAARLKMGRTLRVCVSCVLQTAGLATLHSVTASRAVRHQPCPHTMDAVACTMVHQPSCIQMHEQRFTASCSAVLHCTAMVAGLEPASGQVRLTWFIT